MALKLADFQSPGPSPAYSSLFKLDHPMSRKIAHQVSTKKPLKISGLESGGGELTATWQKQPASTTQGEVIHNC
jgi:hypothetical protein